MYRIFGPLSHMLFFMQINADYIRIFECFWNTCTRLFQIPHIRGNSIVLFCAVTVVLLLPALVAGFSLTPEQRLEAFKVKLVDQKEQRLEAFKVKLADLKEPKGWTDEYIDNVSLIEGFLYSSFSG